MDDPASRIDHPEREIGQDDEGQNPPAASIAIVQSLNGDGSSSKK